MNKIFLIIISFIFYFCCSIGCSFSQENNIKQSESFQEIKDIKFQKIENANPQNLLNENKNIPEEEEEISIYIEETPIYIEETIWSLNEQYNNSNLDAFTGVNYYDNRKETYYSSNILYHYRTNEWIIDDEGFYRDIDGYYVVAASDYEQETIFETSKGMAKVYDTGCPAGVTDFYVNW